MFGPFAAILAILVWGAVKDLILKSVTYLLHSKLASLHQEISEARKLIRLVYTAAHIYIHTHTHIYVHTLVHTEPFS
jgi:hypothetical protein